MSVAGFDVVFSGQPDAAAKASAWAASQGFTSVAEIVEVGDEMIDQMTAAFCAARTPKTGRVDAAASDDRWSSRHATMCRKTRSRRRRG